MHDKGRQKQAPRPALLGSFGEETHQYGAFDRLAGAALVFAPQAWLTAQMDASTRADLQFLTLPGLVDAAAARDPAGLAWDGAQRLTFADLAAEVGCLAAGLWAWGLRPGDRAAIQAPNQARWAIAALAIQAVGAALVPLNTRYKGEETADILRRSGARLLFTTRGFLGVDYWAQVQGQGLDSLVGIDLADEGGAGLLPYAALRAAAPIALPPVSPDAVADILFTSGTTGRPRGVLTTHAQTLRTFGDWAAIVGLRAGDRYLVVPPFFHAFGYKAGWLACLIVGATALPQAVFDVEAVVGRLVAEGITTLTGPPTLFQSLLDRAAAVRAAPLRLAVTGAAVVPVELVARMRSDLGFENVLTAYGLTECCGVATMCRAGDPPDRVAHTSGRSIPGVELRVVGPDRAPLPPGEAGEIELRGFNLMLGYLDDPEGTAATLKDGWLLTGDVGWVDVEGYLRITDRLKDMFVVGGFKAFPAEIEAGLRRFPGLVDVAVVGMPDPRLGEVGCAFVVGAVDLDALAAFARQTMANFKAPRQYLSVESLPRNASGKVLKGLLRAQVAAMASTPPSAAAG